MKTYRTYDQVNEQRVAAGLEPLDIATLVNIKSRLFPVNARKAAKTQRAVGKTLKDLT